MFNLIRIDATTLPSLIFGGLLVLVSIAMLLYIQRSLRASETSSPADELFLNHAQRQYRRRMQIGGMLGLIGVLIAVGDRFENLFKAKPLLFVLWVLGLLALTVWAVLLALGDWLSTMALSSVTKVQLRHERRELELELERYHAAKKNPAPPDAKN